MTLRCVTYLAAEPGEAGLPRSLFADIAGYVATQLGVDATVEVARCGSGPRQAEDDAFARGDADLGWVCAPSMLWLHERGSVSLVPASMVLDDPRSAGRPEYWCEVVVREEQAATRVEHLRGAVAAFNDRASLSGFGSLLGRVQGLGGEAFFERWVATGSHARSVAAVRDGSADVAVVDANVWRLMDRRGLRVVESLGPFPIQPMVVRRGAIDPDAVARVLLSWQPGGILRGFAPVTVEGIRRSVPWAAMQSSWTAR